MTKWLKRYFTVILWAFFIFFGSSLPAIKASENFGIDFLVHKAVHVFEYSILYLLYYRSSVEDIWEKKPDRIFYSLAFVALFGVFDEYHQSFVPGRNPRVRDVFVDFVGGLFGLFVWWNLRRGVQKERKS